MNKTCATCKFFNAQTFQKPCFNCLSVPWSRKFGTDHPNWQPKEGHTEPASDAMDAFRYLTLVVENTMAPLKVHETKDEAIARLTVERDYYKYGNLNLRMKYDKDMAAKDAIIAEQNKEIEELKNGDPRYCEVCKNPIAARTNVELIDKLRTDLEEKDKVIRQMNAELKNHHEYANFYVRATNQARSIAGELEAKTREKNGIINALQKDLDTAIKARDGLRQTVCKWMDLYADLKREVTETQKHK